MHRQQKGAKEKEAPQCAAARGGGRECKYETREDGGDRSRAKSSETRKKRKRAKAPTWTPCITGPGRKEARGMSAMQTPEQAMHKQHARERTRGRVHYTDRDGKRL